MGFPGYSPEATLTPEELAAEVEARRAEALENAKAIFEAGRQRVIAGREQWEAKERRAKTLGFIVKCALAALVLGVVVAGMKVLSDTISRNQEEFIKRYGHELRGELQPALESDRAAGR